MKITRMPRIGIIAVVLPLVSMTACPQPKNPEAFSWTDCVDQVFRTSESDPRALAQICRATPEVAKDILPLLVNLIGVREGSRRAGVVWIPLHGDAGAGAPTDAAADASR